MGDRTARAGWQNVAVDDQALAAHDLAVASGAEAYLDPATGFVVFTSAYLAARGTCCDSGCRHCPFPTVDPDGRS